MSESRVTTRYRMMENIRNKIGLSDKNSTYLVEDLGKKIEDIIKGMTKYELMK